MGLSGAKAELSIRYLVQCISAGSISFESAENPLPNGRPSVSGSLAVNSYKACGKH